MQNLEFRGNRLTPIWRLRNLFGLQSSRHLSDLCGGHLPVDLPGAVHNSRDPPDGAVHVPEAELPAHLPDGVRAVRERLLADAGRDGLLPRRATGAGDIQGDRGQPANNSELLQDEDPEPVREDPELRHDPLE